MHRHTIHVLLVIGGWLSVTLGVIGIFLPLWPTTPFILLAAFCFANSSEKFHQWLLNHPLFGPIVRAWDEGKGIQRKTRNFAIVLMWSGMTVSMLIVYQWWSFLLLTTIGILTTIYMANLPSYD